MMKMDFAEKRLELLNETKQKISKSIQDDNLISQSISSITEIDKAVNLLSKRLREWYELYNPELSHSISDHENFISVILENPLRIENSMGGYFSEDDLSQVLRLAEKIKHVFEEKELLINYVRNKMEVFCPNVLEVCGPLIGAKILAHKGTLKELAFLPASTIQLLGAEKALFRHIKSNARSPKYGYILQHQDVAKAENKGKAARQLANKISIAAKKDYFSKVQIIDNIEAQE